MGQEEKKLPDELEEAAEKASKTWRRNEDGSESKELFPQTFVRGFIAGAEWQREQMGKQAREQLAKDEITLADLVAFDEGTSLGRRLERQKMMEKAVDGRYMKADGKVYVESWLLDIDPDSVKAGDEVRLIVFPKED